MPSRARTSDLRKYLRHVLTAGGALLLVAAAGLDRAGPNVWPGAGNDAIQQARVLAR